MAWQTSGMSDPLWAGLHEFRLSSGEKGRASHAAGHTELTPTPRLWRRERISPVRDTSGKPGANARLPRHGRLNGRQGGSVFIRLTLPPRGTSPHPTQG